MNAFITSTHTHVGTPPPGYNQGWVTHTVHWHGFPSLSTLRGVGVASHEFMLLGNQWRLEMIPGGHARAGAGMVSLGLANMSNKAIEIDYGFSVNDGNGKQVVYEQSPGPRNFGPVGAVDTDGNKLNNWGFSNFATRLSLLSSLINGTAIIEVHMRLAKPTKSVPPPFIPENPFPKNIQQKFTDENFGDISFVVGGQQQKKDNAKKVAKATTVMFHAHRAILHDCSTGILADICRSNVASTSSPIEITDVSSDVFRHLLQSAYGVKISDDDMKLRTKEIIDAANKYGIVNLKLEAEACFVRDIVFSLENVMEHLLYADSMNCALLKETAMDYLVENSAEALDTISFNDLLTPTLIRDVFAAFARGKKNDESDGDGSGESRFYSMRISELRREAHEKGLNVDGSREMLIAALK